jgi:hypothetical protein
MRTLGWVLLIGASVFCGAKDWGRAQTSPSETAKAGIADQGTFVLNLAGKQVGSEQFSIKSVGDRVQAEGETQMQEEGGRHPNLIVTYSKLILDSALNPQLYTWSTKGPKKYNLFVDFTTPLAKCQLHQPDGKDDIREFQLAKNVVILDNNVIHHYQLLLDRYNRTAGGKQLFNAFIPQAALPGELTVQDAGMENIQLAGKAQSLRHLVVSTDNAQIDLWQDAEGRLVRLYWSSAKLEALREP